MLVSWLRSTQLERRTRGSRFQPSHGGWREQQGDHLHYTQRVWVLRRCRDGTVYLPVCLFHEEACRGKSIKILRFTWLFGVSYSHTPSLFFCFLLGRSIVDRVFLSPSQPSRSRRYFFCGDMMASRDKTTRRLITNSTPSRAKLPRYIVTRGFQQNQVGVPPQARLFSE